MYYLLEYTEKRFYVIYLDLKEDEKTDLVMGTVMAFKDHRPGFGIGEGGFGFFKSEKEGHIILFKSKNKFEVMERFYLAIL